MSRVPIPAIGPPRRRRRLRRGTLAGITAALIAAVALAAAHPSPAAASSPTLQVWLTTTNNSNAITPQASITLGPVTSGGINVAVNDSLTYQTMSGFGAAFTDSSTYLMNQLKGFNSTSYNTLMNELFSTGSGIGLSFWRLPMTSTDFNSTNTTWSDDSTPGPSNDPDEYFGLSPDETNFIIPTIQDALAINPNIQIVASPWSAPAWMKSNNSMFGSTNGVNGTLLSSDYQAWADYFRDWLNAYHGEGIPIFAITPQNEPQYGPAAYPGMVWDNGTDEGNWVNNYLAPTLSAAGLSPQILGWDHNWDIPNFPEDMLSTAGSNLSGLSWHCYDSGSDTADPTRMTQLHNINPSMATYEAECSSTSAPTDIIGYTTSAMALLSVQNWAKGVIMWNAALNASNGPVVAGGCSNCAPIVTINPTLNGSGHVIADSVTLDNNYYQLGQLSEFVPVGATHINSTVTTHGIVTAAFKNPDGCEVLVATNTNSSPTTFETTWNGQGSFSYTLPAGATVTFKGTVPAAPVLSSTPTAGHTYKIISRVTDKPIDVSGESTANGARIVQSTDDDDPSQQWELVSAGNGYYNIINVNSGKALDDTNGSTSNGNPMQQYTITGTGNSNQQWQITANGSWYTITNLTSGIQLNLTNGLLADGTTIQQWASSSSDPNAQWQFVPVS
jgi:glucosylceramidase